MLSALRRSAWTKSRAKQAFAKVMSKSSCGLTSVASTSGGGRHESSRQSTRDFCDPAVRTKWLALSQWDSPPFPPSDWGLTSAVYEIQTPEPGTWLLVPTAVGLAWRKKMESYIGASAASGS